MTNINKVMDNVYKNQITTTGDTSLNNYLRDINQMGSNEDFFGVWYTNFELEKDVYYCNDIVIKLLGMDPNLSKYTYDLWYKSVLESNNKKETEKIFNEYNEFVKGERNYFSASYKINKGKSLKYVYTYAYALTRDDNGNAIIVQGNTVDITNSKKNSMKVERLHNEFKLAAKGACFNLWNIKRKENGYVLYLQEDNIGFFSNRKKSLIIDLDEDGYSNEKKSNQYLLEPFKNIIDQCFEKEDNETVKYDFTRKVGKSEKHYRLQGSVTERDHNNLPITVSGITFDLTSEKEYENKILQLVNHDELTNMLNRNSFYSELETKDTLCIIMISLDDTKALNNTFGQLGCDDIIKEISGRVLKLGYDNTLYRIGDNFIIKIKKFMGDKAYLKYARLILKAINEPFEYQSSTVKVTASIGIASAKEDECLNSLFQRASYASEYVKRNGKNNIKISDDALIKAQQRYREVELALKSAIENKEFEPFFQSKFDLSTDNIVGVEALARWNNEQLGMIYPDEFIPILERKKLVSSVDKMITEKSIKIFEKWIKEGVVDPYKFTLSFNFSVDTIMNSNVVEFFEEMREKYSVPLTSLEVEITESIAVLDFKKLNQRLRSLSNLGLRTSLDDFSAGNSTLVSLAQSVFNTIKIDKGMILNTNLDESAQEIYKFMVRFCNNFDLNLVAEGIETNEHVLMLNNLGVKIGQGYLKNKPCSEANMKNLIIGVA